MSLCNVEEGAAVGTEQPFVGGEDEEIGIETAHIGADDTGRVRRINEQRGAVVAKGRGDTLHVDHRAIGPVHGGDGRERNGRGAGLLDGGKDGRGPVSIVRLRHDIDGEPCGRRAGHPFQHGR